MLKSPELMKTKYTQPRLALKFRRKNNAGQEKKRCT